MTEQTEQEDKLAPQDWVKLHYGPTNELNGEQMRWLLKTLIRYYGSQKACAEVLGIGAKYLSDIINTRRTIGPAVLEALGFKKEPVYQLGGTS